ncbi:MAG: hypothetical protein JWN04_2435 [Myxococcaceae bacterium]|nr:hypothetical protein [Myxococcaceae bacterium]
MGSLTRTSDGHLVIAARWWIRAAAWPVAALVAESHLAWGDGKYSDQTLLCAGLLAAVAVIAAAYARAGEVPVIQLILIRFYFAMGYQVFSPPRLYGSNALPIRISSRSLDKAAAGGIIFAAALLVGFAVARLVARRFSADFSRILDRRSAYGGADTITVRVLSGCSIAMYLALAFSPSGQTMFGGFGYSATLLSAPALSLGLLFWDAERQSGATPRLIFWAAVTLIVCGALAQGMVGSVAEPFTVIAIFMWTARGRVPIALLATAIIGLMALNTAKTVYRGLTWRKQRDVGLIERAENWATALDRTYSGDRDEAIENTTSATASRLSSFMQVAHMMEWVPARVPHAGPKAWVQLPLEFVPRLVWSDKPQHAAEFNNRYTLTFGLQTRLMSQSTTYSLPSIGDGYWRLGWLGVVIEGLLLGLLTGAYQGLAGPGSRALTIVAAGFATRASPESHILGLLAGVPQNWIMMIGVLLLAQALPSLIIGSVKTRLTGAGTRPLRTR